MIFLIFLFALTVNASEIDLQYRWYKYENSSYMSINESKNIKDAYVDYNDYRYDNYYNINEYINLKGRYVYIYNKTNKNISFNYINIYSKNKLIDYVKVELSDKVMLIDLNDDYFLKDLTFDIKYSGGYIDVNFSSTSNDSKDASVSLMNSSKFSFYRIKNNNEIYYKTYYNRVNGEYNPTAYDDYTYKDLNDYIIYYFYLNDTIYSKDTKLEDLIDTNYTLLEIEGEIDYNENGKYNIRYIFGECIKDVVINVNIVNNDIKSLKEKNSKLNESIRACKEKNNNLNSSIKKLKKDIKVCNKENDKLIDLSNKNKVLIDELNSFIKDKDNIILSYEKEIKDNKIIYEKNKNNYNSIVKLKNTCFSELDSVIKKSNEKIRDLSIMNNKYKVDLEYKERYIKKLKYVIDEKDVDFWRLKKCSSFVSLKKAF